MMRCKAFLVLLAGTLGGLLLSACMDQSRASTELAPLTENAPFDQVRGEWESEVKPCRSPETFEADPESLPDLIYNLPDCSVVELAPGHYSEIMPVEVEGLTLRCAVPALRHGHPNPYGCHVRTIIPVRVGTLIVEGIYFTGIATNYYGTEDYGLQIHDVEYLRVSNNVFHGLYNHDISTKENVFHTEVFNNLFVRCRRHCVEVGQNGSVDSRPQQSGTMIIKGNFFDTPTLHAVTQRANATMIVEHNYFRNVGRQSIQNWPYWQEYDYGQPEGPEKLLLPEPPLLTVITANIFEGDNSFRFEGRGVEDDVILIHGNSGRFSCRRVNMDPETAEAHRKVDTSQPPQLDAASDVDC